jgi:hypothetical protein
VNYQDAAAMVAGLHYTSQLVFALAEAKDHCVIPHSVT